MTLADYARHRGCTAQAVSVAFQRGKLGRAAGHTIDGRPMIVDPDLADREWANRTRPRGESAPTPIARIAPVRAAPVAAAEPGNPAEEFHVSRARKEAAEARRAETQAELAELQLAERRGELVEAEEMELEWLRLVTAAKTRLLGVPDRVAQRHPDLTPAHLESMDVFIREALEELADDGDDEQ